MEKAKKITFHVISHTHWDREWYLPFEVFRIELVNLIDNLLNILKQNEDFIFHLDGQSIILQDYLEINPEKEEEIKHYIKSGKLLTGPWYVLSDQFLTSGEATIRNLLYGIRFSKKFGKTMMIGYCPDQFGQIAQLPQIFKGFNINSAIVGRGLQDSISEHNWYGLNGDTVVTISLTHWYNNAQRFPSEKEKLSSYIDKLYNTQSQTSKSGHILLMNGCDHLFAQSNLSEILSNTNGSKNWELKLDNLETAVNEIVENTSVNEYPIYFGELRDDNNKYILAGTLSSRVYLKLDNYICQTKIEKIIEPLSTLLVLNKQISYYPYNMIKYAWKLLIQNHAHDSICGCSTDEVHKEMETRFLKVKQVAKKLQEELLNNSCSTETNNCLQVINTTGFHRKEIIEAELEFPLGPPAEHPSAIPTINKNKVEDIKLKHKGKSIAHEIIESYETFKMVRSKEEVPLLQAIQKIKIVFEADVEPLAIKSYEIEQCASSKNKENKFENDHYMLSGNKDGTLTLSLKDANCKFENIHMISIEDDLGDEYNFVPNGDLKTLTSKDFKWNIKTIEENSLRKKLLLEIKNNGSFELRTEVTCYSNSDRIDFSTRIKSNLKNKRIRLHFPDTLNTNLINADTPFGCIKRARPPIDWTNYAFSQPLHNWIDHSNDSCGFAFFGGGLADYELYKDGNGFAVTLIRAIGKLSKVKSHSMIETPDAQCNREINFSYAIYPHSRNIQISNIYENQLAHQVPLITSQSSQQIDKPSIITLSKELVLSTLKRAEDNENLYIVRLFNPTDKNLFNCFLHLNFEYKKILLLNLNEDSKKTIEPSGKKDTIDFDLKPFEIVTFSIEV